MVKPISVDASRKWHVTSQQRQMRSMTPYREPYSAVLLTSFKCSNHIHDRRGLSLLMQATYDGGLDSLWPHNLPLFMLSLIYLKSMVLNKDGGQAYTPM